MKNSELKLLVLANLPIQDNSRIVIRGHRPDPAVNGFKFRPFIDVTKQVKQLLQEGKIKRIRKYGFGINGRAGHTFFVENK